MLLRCVYCVWTGLYLSLGNKYWYICYCESVPVGIAVKEEEVWQAQVHGMQKWKVGARSKLRSHPDQCYGMVDTSARCVLINSS